MDTMYKIAANTYQYSDTLLFSVIQQQALPDISAAANRLLYRLDNAAGTAGAEAGGMMSDIEICDATAPPLHIHVHDTKPTIAGGEASVPITVLSTDLVSEL